MDESGIRERMSRYKFYDVIRLTDNVVTPGNPEYAVGQDLVIKQLRSLDVKGKRVLDIGCRDGRSSFVAESMGASEVVGIDNDLSKAAVEFLIPFFNSKVKMHQLNLYKLTPDSFGLFDVVICSGLLYHLRYPFWGLKAIRDVMKAGGHLILSTQIWRGESHNALLFCPINGESPYDPTSCTFFNEKGLLDTLKSMGFKNLRIEYNLGEKAEGKAKACAKRLMSLIAGKPEDRPPITVHEIKMGVFHFEFLGYDAISFVAQYWDTTHDFHSSHGG